MRVSSPTARAEPLVAEPKVAAAAPTIYQPHGAPPRKAKQESLPLSEGWRIPPLSSAETGSGEGRDWA